VHKILFYQSFLHVTSHSEWELGHVMDHGAKDCDRLLVEASDADLILDETGIPEKRELSVATSRLFLPSSQG
jgi:SRSO17 transposase